MIGRCESIEDYPHIGEGRIGKYFREKKGKIKEIVKTTGLVAGILAGSSFITGNYFDSFFAYDALENGVDRDSVRKGNFSRSISGKDHESKIKSKKLEIIDDIANVYTRPGREIVLWLFDD